MIVSTQRSGADTGGDGNIDVLLIGNYQRDGQESMLRFASLLCQQLPKSGLGVMHISPKEVFGALPTNSSMAKWTAYIDKYLIFPFALRRWLSRYHRRRAGRTLIIHICDHSNAMYTWLVRGAPVVVTCHDLLAVRGALGEDTDCPASTMGRWLQRAILSGIGRASFVVCDSTATQADLHRLLGDPMKTKSMVVILAQNYPYRKIEEEAARVLLQSYKGLDSGRPFLLHVGSDLLRKNRDMLLRVGAHLGKLWKGQIVFAGERLGERSLMLMESLGLCHSVVQIVKPSNPVLEALYSVAFALVFPSRCEGFGWPVIEAQACGCPVICSDQSSLPEIAGKGAIFCAPDNVEKIGEAVKTLSFHDIRSSLVQQGLENAGRFKVETMVDRYRDIYRALGSSDHRAATDLR